MFGADRAAALRGRSTRIEARAQVLLPEIAARHGLRCEWIEGPDICLEIPKQERLDFTVSLAVLNADELAIVTEFFVAEWFPCDDPRKESDFRAAADGLLSGSMRFVATYGRRDVHPRSVILEMKELGSWVGVFTYGRLGWSSFRKRREVIINKSGPDFHPSALDLL